MDESYYRLHAEQEATHWWFLAKNRIIMRLIARYGPASGRACDVGCGAGGLLLLLRERFDAVGVDMSPLALEYCSKRGLPAVEGGLPDTIPLEDGSFDVVVATEVIEHVAADRASVQRLARLLRPGGILVCTVPAHQWLWSRHDDLNHHQRRYTRKTFAPLFEGLPLERIVLGYYQTALFPLMVAFRLAENLRGKTDDAAGVRPMPAFINTTFRALFQSEGALIGRIPFPTGGSMISVHRRR